MRLTCIPCHCGHCTCWCHMLCLCFWRLVMPFPCRKRQQAPWCCAFSGTVGGTGPCADYPPATPRLALVVQMALVLEMLQKDMEGIK